MNGKILTLAWAGGRIADQQTGSTWTILGAAVAGPLKGARLPPVVHGQQFWFSWAVFRPKTRVYQPH